MSPPKKPLAGHFQSEAEQFHAHAPGLTGEELSDFFDAVTDGNLSGTRAFLDKYPKLVSQPIINSAPPLMRAVYYRQLEAARILLAKGADPNIGDLSDWTALVYAARNGQMEMIQLLLDFGAAPDRQIESSGITPLMHTIFANQPEALRLFLERGADPDVKTAQGKTALDFALEREQEQPETVALLKNHRRRKEEAQADIKARAVASKTLGKLKTRRPPKPPFRKGPA